MMSGQDAERLKKEARRLEEEGLISKKDRKILNQSLTGTCQPVLYS